MRLEDLRCKCKRPECDAVQPDELLLERLKKLESLLGQTLTITSGVRCSYWNTHEGGKPTSGHMKSQEVDIGCKDSVLRWKLVLQGPSVGFSRVGIGKNFVHLGYAPDLPQHVIWHYY